MIKNSFTTLKARVYITAEYVPYTDSNKYDTTLLFPVLFLLGHGGKRILPLKSLWEKASLDDILEWHDTWKNLRMIFEWCAMITTILFWLRRLRKIPELHPSHELSKLWDTSISHGHIYRFSGHLVSPRPLDKLEDKRTYGIILLTWTREFQLAGEHQLHGIFGQIDP